MTNLDESSIWSSGFENTDDDRQGNFPVLSLRFFPRKTGGYDVTFIGVDDRVTLFFATKEEARDAAPKILGLPSWSNPTPRDTSQE